MDNPQAFPTINQEYNYHGGMSLRDYFASAALTSLIVTNSEVKLPPEDVAKCAFIMADAMLRERKGQS